MIFTSQHYTFQDNLLSEILDSLQNLLKTLAKEKKRIEESDLRGFTVLVLEKEQATNKLIKSVNKFIKNIRDIALIMQESYSKSFDAQTGEKFAEFVAFIPERTVAFSDFIGFFQQCQRVLEFLEKRRLVPPSAIERNRIESMIKKMDLAFSKIKDYEKTVKENKVIVKTFLEFQTKSIRFWQGVQREMESVYGQDGKASMNKASPIFEASA